MYSALLQSNESDKKPLPGLQEMSPLILIKIMEKLDWENNSNHKNRAQCIQNICFDLDALQCNLSMCCKSLSNAFKHAKPGIEVIEIRFNEKFVSLTLMGNRYSSLKFYKAINGCQLIRYFTDCSEDEEEDKEYEETVSTTSLAMSAQEAAVKHILAILMNDKVDALAFIVFFKHGTMAYELDLLEDVEEYQRGLSEENIKFTRFETSMMISKIVEEMKSNGRKVKSENFDVVMCKNEDAEDVTKLMEICDFEQFHFRESDSRDEPDSEDPAARLVFEEEPKLLLLKLPAFEKMCASIPSTASEIICSSNTSIQCLPDSWRRFNILTLHFAEFEPVKFVNLMQNYLEREETFELFFTFIEFDLENLNAILREKCKTWTTFRGREFGLWIDQEYFAKVIFQSSLESLTNVPVIISSITLTDFIES